MDIQHLDQLKLAHFDDIHVEHGAWVAPTLLDVDIITLGGDIAGNPQDYLSVVQDLRDKNPDALIVGILGNHEHYKREIISSTQEYAQLSGKVPGFEMLIGGRSIEHKGWKIIGATLWTNIPEIWEEAAFRVLNDYRKITIQDSQAEDGFRLLKPSDITKVHKQTVSKLEKILKNQDNSKTIVLSHHAPSFKSWTWTGEKAKEKEGAEPFYCSNLDKLILETQPTLWLHGHIHNPADYHIGKTRIANNARGYWYSHDLNEGFFEQGFQVTLHSKTKLLTR